MSSADQLVSVSLQELSALCGSVNSVGVFSAPVGLALDALHAAADDLQTLAIATAHGEPDMAISNALAGLGLRLETVEDIVARLAGARDEEEVVQAAERDLETLKQAAEQQGGAT